MPAASTSPRVSRPLPPQVVIYGGGEFGRRVGRHLELIGVEVAGYIDQRRIMLDAGHEAVDLEEAKLLTPIPLIIGIHNPYVDIRGIARELASIGFKDVRTPVQVAQDLFAAGTTLVNYWLTGDPTAFDDDAISQARSLLADEKSALVYNSVLNYRVSGDPDALLDPDPLHLQYAPDDLPFLTNDMRFVDVGGYDGDTVRLLKARVPHSMQALLTLEPDPTNFARCAASLSEWTEIVGLALPLGLSDSSRLLRFDANGDSSATVSSTGDVTIQAVALDDIAYSWRPTHIKMDIEGGEAEALRGMRRILETHRPNLAISAYHRPQDHWELLLTISSMNLGYDFWIRTYGEQTFETVLYCTQPSSRS